MRLTARLLSRLLAAIAICLLSAPTAALATQVQPSQRVVQWVNVRQGPGTDTPVIARLRPGESVELIDLVPGWYAVRLPDGRTGYVSRGWTVRTDEAALAAVTYRLHLIDIGTGLAVFVEGPGVALLYDAGSADDSASGSRNRVLAYVRHARPDLTTFDHVILSHPHQDHVALLPELMMIYRIRNVWDSGLDYENCDYYAFLRVARDKQIPYHDAHAGPGPHAVHVPRGKCRRPEGEQITVPHASHIQTGAPIDFGPAARITFLHADATELGNANENSLVMALDIGRTRVLFMGDAEAGGRESPSVRPKADSAEGRLLACCAAALKSDVLIAGHHGSRTSSRTATLNAIGAYIFLVSSGPKKYSGVTLPDQDVIDEFARRGTVYRTDLADAACKTNPAKIGPDKDNKPGGCDNVVLTIDSLGHIAADYNRSAD